MNNNQQVLGTEPIGKLLIKYSLPAIIGMMVNGLYNVVDRIFIGNMPGVGPLAITGLGVTMPIMTIMLAFGMLIGVGTATNISIKLGQGKRDDPSRRPAREVWPDQAADRGADPRRACQSGLDHRGRPRTRARGGRGRGHGSGNRSGWLSKRRRRRVMTRLGVPGLARSDGGAGTRRGICGG